MKEYASRLSRGEKNVCMAMTDEYQKPGKDTFSHVTASYLYYAGPRLGIGLLCERLFVNDQWGRPRIGGYRLTPLGLEMKAYLIETAKIRQGIRRPKPYEENFIKA